MTANTTIYSHMTAEETVALFRPEIFGSAPCSPQLTLHLFFLLEASIEAAKTQDAKIEELTAEANRLETSYSSLLEETQKKYRNHEISLSSMTWAIEDLEDILTKVKTYIEEDKKMLISGEEVQHVEV